MPYRTVASCHGLDKLWKWKCGFVCVNVCMNDGALKAGKKLYIYLYVARTQHVTRVKNRELLNSSW
jgi:hypothetical protein